MFPTTRLRRLRMNPIIRNMVQENHLRKEDFIYPLFVLPGKGIKKEVSSMPGVFQHSIDEIIKECEACLNLGLKNIILFGLPEDKDNIGSSALKENGIIQKTLKAIKKEFKDELLLITDLCFCEYTDHGHCGVIINNSVDNDNTINMLGDQAISHCQAGADIIAPSGMMDGMVLSIRMALDETGFKYTPIMSYAVKYASAYYGPFRDAAESTPQFGDRKNYQMNPANHEEALLEAEEDINEGADILMVKPALPYLDIIKNLREQFHQPIAAYQVSGEYSMIKGASQLGYIDEQMVAIETFTSIKRAGANIILTYYAKELCHWINEGIL